MSSTRIPIIARVRTVSGEVVETTQVHETTLVDLLVLAVRSSGDSAVVHLGPASWHIPKGGTILTKLVRKHERFELKPGWDGTIEVLGYEVLAEQMEQLMQQHLEGQP